MKMTKILIIFVAALAAGMIACAPETEVEMTDTAMDTSTETALDTDTSMTSDMTAEIWVDDPTLGSELNEEGRVAFGFADNDFVVGDKIYYAMEIGDAPADANIRVVWFAPGDAQLHEETQQVQPGQDYMHFEAPDTSGWAPGDYRVEVYANDERAHEEDFNVEAAGT